MTILTLLFALSSFAVGLDPELVPDPRFPEPVCKPVTVALTVEQASHDDVNCAPGSKCIGGRCVGGDCR